MTSKLILILQSHLINLIINGQYLPFCFCKLVFLKFSHYLITVFQVLDEIPVSQKMHAVVLELLFPDHILFFFFPSPSCFSLQRLLA